MAGLFENSVTYQYIANSDYTGTNIFTTPMSSGQVAIIIDGGGQTASPGTVVTGALTAAYYYKVAACVNGIMEFSPPFTAAGTTTLPIGTHVGIVNSAVLTAFDQELEEIWNVGATSGTTGTAVTGLGTVTAGVNYTMSLWLSYTQAQVGSTPYIKTIPYLAVSGDGQQQLAKGISDQAIKIVKRHTPYPLVRVERLANGVTASIVAGANAANTVQVTNGSTLVKVLGIDCTTLCTVGTIIRLWGAAFIITASSFSTDTSLTLDQAWQGPSGYVLVPGTSVASVTILNKYTATFPAASPAGTVPANGLMMSLIKGVPEMFIGQGSTTVYTACRYLGTGTLYWVSGASWTAATYGDGYSTAANVSAWGLRITGQKPSLSYTAGPVGIVGAGFDPIAGDFQKVRTKLTFSGFDYSVASAAQLFQEAYEGTGNYEQVAIAEVMSRFNDGRTQVSQYPPTNYSRLAQPTGNGNVLLASDNTAVDYSIISFTCIVPSNKLSGAGTMTSSNFNIVIACAGDSGASAATTGGVFQGSQSGADIKACLGL